MAPKPYPTEDTRWIREREKGGTGSCLVTTKERRTPCVFLRLFVCSFVRSFVCLFPKTRQPPTNVPCFACPIYEQPNIKRRFADDDPSDDDEEDSEEEEDYPIPMRGGGKGFRMPGGKGMGKQLRYVPQNNDEDDSDEDDSDDDEDDSDDSDDDDDSDEEEAPPPQPIRPVQRGGGKALMRPSGGKQLRPP